VVKGYASVIFVELLFALAHSPWFNPVDCFFSGAKFHSYAHGSIEKWLAPMRSLFDKSLSVFFAMNCFVASLAVRVSERGGAPRLMLVLATEALTKMYSERIRYIDPSSGRMAVLESTQFV
jgi:hypothetical protein